MSTDTPPPTGIPEKPEGFFISWVRKARNFLVRHRLALIIAGGSLLVAGTALVLFLVFSGQEIPLFSSESGPSLSRLYSLTDDPEPAYEGPLGEGNMEFREIVQPPRPEDYEGYGYGGDGGWEYARSLLIPPVRPTDPFRIRFSKEVSGDSGNTSEENPIPGIEISFDPSFEYTWEWYSPRELRITPAEGELFEGQRISYSYHASGGGYFFSGGGEVDVGTFEVSQKIGQSTGYASHVTPGAPEAVLVLGDGSNTITSQGAYILFDQVVSPEQIKLEVTSGGRKISGTLEPVQGLPMDPDGLFDPEFCLYLAFSQPQKPGRELEITLAPKNREEMEGGPGMGYFTCTVAPPLTWSAPDLERAEYEQDSPSDSPYLDLQSDIRLEFSTPVSLDQVRQNFSLSMEKGEGRVYFYQSGDIYASLTLSYGARGNISFNEGLTDLLGQSLEPSSEEGYQSYAIRARDKDPELHLPSGMITLEEGQDRLPVKVLNPGDLTLEIDRFQTAQDFLLALNGYDPENSPLPGKRIEAPSLTSSSRMDLMNELFKADVAIDGEPGLKLVTVTAAGEGSEAGKISPSDQVFVQTTGIALSAKVTRGKLLAWAVDMGTREPVAGASVLILTGDGGTVAQGTTSGEGTALLTYPEPTGGMVSPRYLTVSQGKDTAITPLDPESLSKAWQFNLPGLTDGPEVLPAALFTDRGAYRPGEAVNFKAFLRPDYREDLENLTLRIRDSRGTTIYEKIHTLDDMGGLDGTVNLSAGAPLGEYLVELQGDESTRSATFRVEEYRVPTFSVKVKPQGAINAGTPAQMEVTAAYLRGGALDGRTFQWRVYRQPELYRSSLYPDYLFGLYPGASMTGTVAQGSGVLNPEGTGGFTFTPDHPAEEGQMRYIAEASVQDVDRQVYAGRISALVNPSGFRIGIKPPRQSLYKAGSILRIPFILLNKEGQPVTGSKVLVQLNRVEYHTTTMENETGSTQTFNRSVLREETIGYDYSESTPKTLGIRIPETGSWQLKLIYEYEPGPATTLVCATEFLFSSYGDENAPWPRFDRDRYELMTDRQEYQVGDIIRIMPQSPYPQAAGLLTVEAGGILTHKMVRLDSNSQGFEVPVTPDMIPNAFISLTLVRPRVHDQRDGTGFQTGAPGYKVGYAQVKVRPAGRTLKVDISGAPEVSSPGQEYSFTLKATNPQGTAVPASVAVFVVDEGVLALTGYKTPDPLKLAYIFRGLGVSNGSNVLDMPHSRRIRNESLFPGGDADIAALMEAADAQDRQDLVRKLFKSTAYWNPDLRISSAAGEKVTFTLPDNLTSYRIMVVGVDGKGLMGSSEARFQCSKPLTVQPVLPRFLNQGDQADLEVQVINGLQEDREVTLEGSFEGLELRGEARQSGTVKAGGWTLFTFPVTALRGEGARIRFSAQAGDLTDVVELPVILRMPNNRTSVVTSGFLSSGESLTLEADTNHIPGSLQVDAVFHTTPLAGLKPSLDYLLDYPNGCIEQTTSKAYPLVVLRHLIPQMGTSVEPGKLRDMAEAGIKRIQTFTTPSGGLSYWPGQGDPHNFGSVYGLTILTEAKAQGYPVDAEVYNRLRSYVETNLGSGAWDGSHEVAAYAAYVLDLAGRPQTGAVEKLARQKEKLNLFSLALTLMASSRRPVLSQTTGELLAHLVERSQSFLETLSQGKAAYSGSPLGSSVRDSAVLVMALQKADPQHPQASALLDHLLNLMKANRWHSTQERVFGMMALNEVFGKAGSSPSALTLGLNGETHPVQAAGKPGEALRFTASPPLPQDGKINLQIQKSEVKLFTTFKASWSTDLTRFPQKPLEEGYTIQRVYLDEEGRNLDGKEIPAGKLVTIRLLVNASQEKAYFALTDFLPAGLEPVNTALETTGTSGQVRLSSEAEETLDLITFREMRDHSVSFYCDALPLGSHEFLYQARATLKGTFFLPPAEAEAMYEPTFRGRSEGKRVSVR